ncbi:hypothetical protein [Pseudorhodoferax sp. Leaf274]|uniref:hypothetical protein n=1 Tax=Pseudorhodoferax sp. Leaf274 TaxID=1736318 RepID=UPI000702BAFA|nr:hypothetical protein [Pseudorhodoferax sp. Leaf274]KQP36101.1 hypothetical protein ASF44_16155 [Pseudorhodoferax sp. Leaf274]
MSGALRTEEEGATSREAVIATLERYNTWRRGNLAGDEMPDPRVIGDAIDQALALLRAAPGAAAAAHPDTERLDCLRDYCLDLRCIDVPTGAGDGDVHWVVIEHHMAKPHEREIGRSYSHDPRAAIDAARAAQAQGGA